MDNAIIKVCDGEYTNDNAIERTIEYIYRLNNNRNLPPYCYGIFPPVYENMIREFQYVRTVQNNVPDRKVWHLVLSFPEEMNRQYFYSSFADKIATLFRNAYMLCYAFHNDTENFHVHFIISATSYIPNYSELNEDTLMQYLYQAQTIAADYNIPLDIIKEEHKNV